MEEALRAAQAHYPLMIEALQEGLLVADAEARITFANGRLAALLGYSVEELLGRRTGELVHEADQELLREQQANRQRGLATQVDIRLRRKDGQTVWTMAAGNPLIDETGAVVGVLATVIDITARKQ